jgi:integrase
VLTWAEVREVWETERLTWPARQAIRLLLISGCRVNEVVQARWDEFDLEGKLWTLPAERSKTHRTLLTPLTPLAIELLGELRAVSGDTFLFPARNVPTAQRPWGGTALGHAVAKSGYDWTARDLRRTWKTLAGGAGLSLDIRNRIQGHALQDVGSRHYDRHGYLEEKRAALMAWERELRARLAGDNVVAFPGRAA